jgi:hypothetical protein
MKRKRIQEEKGSVELVEEAFQLLRTAPGSSLAGYYVGTLPFLLSFLFFWSDMARSAFAHERLMFGVFGLSALFVWMKTWHGVFAQQLLARLCGEPPPRVTFAWLFRIAIYQTVAQPFGLFILPASLVLMIPLAWAYAFFTNITVFSGGPANNLRGLLSKSWQQARLWPVQNHYVIFHFMLFGLFVFLNIMSAMIGIPFLLKTLFGVETIFAQSPWAALNTTTLAAAVAMTFLCLDPVLKATWVLRCFHGESLRTGQDLKAELKSLAASSNRIAAALVLFFTLNTSIAFGAQRGEREEVRGEKAEASALTSTFSPRTSPHASFSPSELDRSIDDVIQRREYSWRLPREAASPNGTDQRDLNFLQRFFEHVESGFKEVHRWIRDFAEWLARNFGRSGPSTDGLSLAGAVKGIVILVLIALGGLFFWLLFRLWQRGGSPDEIVAEPLAPAPNLADENIAADQLPEDGWTSLAHELMRRGELRLALRAYYLATLANLADRNLIALARFKSNRDYERELQRRGHALAVLLGLFSDNLFIFERVWYGLHDVTPEMLQHFAGNMEKLRSA